MQALMLERSEVCVRELPKPELQSRDSVLVRVAYAGVCRTDLYVADQQLRGLNPLILGHECSGFIDSWNQQQPGLNIGDPVSIDPRLPCGHCGGCQIQVPCYRPKILGLHQHGAFAQYLQVPAACIVPLPSVLPEQDAMQRGAYTEPLAAALGVLNIGLDPKTRGLIYGANRIATLTQGLLKLKGFQQIDTSSPAQAPNLPADTYDFIIETQLPPKGFEALIKALKPGGRLILKSRNTIQIPFNPAQIVAKNIILQGVSYGSFTAAANLLADEHLQLSGLMAPPRPLHQFKEVFADARASESQKQFFDIGQST